MTDLNNFRYQLFVAVSGRPGGKIPVVDNVLSSREHELYPNTSVDIHSIEFEFQTDRNVYVDLRQAYLALKIELAKGRGFDTYKTTQRKKEHKEYTVFTETGDDDVELIEEDEGVPHITHVNNVLHSIFSNAELYITTTKSTNRADCMLTNLTFLAKSKVHCQITRESCIVNGMTVKKIQRISTKVHSSLGERNCTVDLTALCCAVSWASTFLQLRNYYIQR